MIVSFCTTSFASPTYLRSFLCAVVGSFLHHDLSLSYTRQKLLMRRPRGCPPMRFLLSFLSHHVALENTKDMVSGGVYPCVLKTYDALALRIGGLGCSFIELH
ncbi:hypothetical protein RJT34_15973 [Clitoria ternatea]|uniref:Uncharacterized protein n=1 Tax=Clitoria ternatea TaxID=43366 RepID=A0AAN9J6D8_CLITE